MEAKLEFEVDVEGSADMMVWRESMDGWMAMSKWWKVGKGVDKRPPY
jgi:hypothetical protein